MGGFVVISCARYEPQASPQVSTAPHGGFLVRPLVQKGYLERGLRRENGCDNEGQTNVREHMLRTTPPQRPFGVPLKHRSTGDDKPLWRSNGARLHALSSCRPATCFPLYPACPQRLDPHVVCAQNTPHGGQTNYVRTAAPETPTQTSMLVPNGKRCALAGVLHGIWRHANTKQHQIFLAIFRQSCPQPGLVEQIATPCHARHCRCHVRLMHNTCWRRARLSRYITTRTQRPSWRARTAQRRLVEVMVTASAVSVAASCRHCSRNPGMFWAKCTDRCAPLPSCLPMQSQVAKQFIVRWRSFCPAR